MTRDERIAGELQATLGAVSTHLSTIRSLVDDATKNGAEAHANMYDEVDQLLSGAWVSLDQAWRIMAKGDAEDYA
jgi:hypothetical protein